MKAVKIIGIIFGVLLVILAIVIFMQPTQARIEKSIVINAADSVIFPQVSNLKNFAEWNPFSTSDPEVKQTFEGTQGTVGSKMYWDGPKTGTGSQWIEEIDQNKRVSSGLQFGGFDAKYHSSFLLEPQSEGTKVTWTYEGPNEGLGGKAMWVIMGPMLTSQYTQGLKTLKKRVEGL